jgi:hypothetical protein
MKRWVAGAVTVLAAVGALAAAGPASASSRAWYQTYKVNRSGTFSDIAAISKTNIWMVGDLGKKNKTTYRPFIWHYGRSGWKTVTIPGAPRFLADQVSASAANNVWVFGRSASSSASTVVYRYDGSRWHKIPLPAETSLSGAVVLGPKNVWAIGSSGTILTYVFRWNGSRWRGYGLPNSRLVPVSIAASASNNVWIAGEVGSGPVVRAAADRWNGNRWHEADMPRVRTHDPSVAAFSRSNVWIGWDTATGFRVTHWDGHHWDTMTTPGDVVANTWNVVPDGKGGYWFGPFAILTGSTWTSEPSLGVSGALGFVVRIPGTESFLLPASVESPGSAIQRPALYRFNL